MQRASLWAAEAEISIRGAEVSGEERVFVWGGGRGAPSSLGWGLNERAGWNSARPNRAVATGKGPAHGSQSDGKYQGRGGESLRH